MTSERKTTQMTPGWLQGCSWYAHFLPLAPSVGPSRLSHRLKVQAGMAGADTQNGQLLIARARDVAERAVEEAKKAAEAAGLDVGEVDWEVVKQRAADQATAVIDAATSTGGATIALNCAKGIDSQHMIASTACVP